MNAVKAGDSKKAIQAEEITLAQILTEEAHWFFLNGKEGKKDNRSLGGVGL